MRISELARDTGVSIPTLKYYLREGLLPPGRATAATQAEYDQEHVARIRLIRALTDVGRLSLAAVRDVLETLDAGPQQVPSAIAAAHESLGAPVRDDDPPPTRALAAVSELGWRVDPRSVALHQLESALHATEDVGIPPDARQFRIYAQAALEVARVDIAGVPTPGSGAAADAVAYVVLGTVLYEPILLALRRLAQQHLYAGGGAPDQPC
jgi:DNA-binding transcriptional MerR regulator